LATVRALRRWRSKFFAPQSGRRTADVEEELGRLQRDVDRDELRKPGTAPGLILRGPFGPGQSGL
jgi:hypothetical protein